jgi:ribosomal protein L11 methyltransferase
MMMLDGPVPDEVGDFFNDVGQVAKFGGTSDPERHMPYRIDLHDPRDDALDRLVALGALDVELLRDGTLAALLPDSVAPGDAANALGVHNLQISAAAGRDADSIWVLNPRPVRIGRLHIVPAHDETQPGTLRLTDAPAFGTGLHPTTALCLEALDEALAIGRPQSVLDVGTGSGVLALAALALGVPRARAIDIDDEALRVAAENARINRLGDRLQLSRGGPETITGTWPLVLANVLAAPLIDMAPALVQRVAHHGHLVLSGIPSSLEHDVDQAYRHLGMLRVRGTSRAGWVALEMRATW